MSRCREFNIDIIVAHILIRSYNLQLTTRSKVARRETPRLKMLLANLDIAAALQEPSNLGRIVRQRRSSRRKELQERPLIAIIAKQRE